jgi:hypothetical protein
MHDTVKHETADGNRKTKKDHVMHGQLGDQRPQSEITGDGADHNPKMSHLSPPEVSVRESGNYYPLAGR